MDDPFSLLGLPLAFDIDPARIERAYLARAAAIHPDIAGDEGDAAVESARLNRAKATLLNPERRANALLAALGGPSKESDKSLPPGFLMEMMETREQVEAAVVSGDAAERARWESWARDQRDGYSANVSSLFKQAAANPKALAEIRQQLNAWRYIERLIEQLDPRYDPARNDFE